MAQLAVWLSNKTQVLRFAMNLRIPPFNAPYSGFPRACLKKNFATHGSQCSDVKKESLRKWSCFALAAK